MEGIVTIEEHAILGGMRGCQLLPRRERAASGVPASTLTGWGSPHLVGNQDYLRTRYGMDAVATVDALTQALELRGPNTSLAQGRSPAPQLLVDDM